MSKSSIRLVQSPVYSCRISTNISKNPQAMYDQPIKCYLSRAFRCGIAVMSQKSEMSVGFFIRRMRLCCNKNYLILYKKMIRSFNFSSAALLFQKQVPSLNLPNIGKGCDSGQRALRVCVKFNVLPFPEKNDLIFQICRI